MAKQYETKKKIIDAIDRLLRAHSIDKIKVSDICKISQVSRTTFYTYFEDVYGAVQWYWDDICERTLYRINQDLGWDEGHRATLAALKEYPYFFQKAFMDKSFRSLFSYGYLKGVAYHIKNLECRLKRSLTQAELQEMDYLGRARSAITTKWAEEGMTVPVEDMIHILHHCIPEVALLLDTEEDNDR